MRKIIQTRTFSDELLTNARQTTDPLADDLVVGWVVAEGKDSLGMLMKILSDYSQKLPDFFKEKHPSWSEFLPETDTQKMRAGIAFFQKHPKDAAVILGCLSLPYTYLGEDGVRVLAMSERMETDTRRRLEETAAFVFGLGDPASWGFASPKYNTISAFERLLRVRLLHAIVRFYASQHWNDTWGKPINQEDMAGTNIAFSYLIIKGLRKNNVNFTDQEAEDFLYFWNIVGQLSGVSKNLLPENLREAFWLDKRIAERQFRVSENGRKLTKALIKTISEFLPEPLRNLPAAQMRFLLGDTHADMLGVPAVEIEKRLVRLLPMKLFIADV